MIYGLLDTQDDVWMGDDDGPITYTDPQLARLAAEVLNDRLKWQPTRIQATPYKGDARSKRDDVECERSFEESLDRLESGRA